MSERFVGVNLWQAMWWGAFDPGRLERELDRLRDLGVGVVRILAGAEGPDDAPHRVVPSLMPEPGVVREDVLGGLVHTLDALASREMKAIVCLGNFWHWSGGLAQYRAWCEGSAIPYPVGDAPDWNGFARYAAGFYDLPEARALFARHVDTILERTRESEAVHTFEILNEPRGAHVPASMRAFLHETAESIRQKSTRGVALGSEGSTDDAGLAGLSFEEDHDHEAITFATIHLWPENWGRWDPLRDDDVEFEEMLVWARRYVRDHAKRAGERPLIVEELGLSRDGGSFDPESTTRRRDRFFAAIADELDRAAEDGANIAGILFWAWAGETLGGVPGGAWRRGDPLSGDPPHEPQGWYGLHESDESTLEIIRKCGRAR